MKRAIVESCEACGGWCCRAIVVSRQVINTSKRGPYEFWTELTLEEAREANPFLPPYLEPNFHNFFKCSHLSNGLCSNYSERPDTCSGYPFYGEGLEELLNEPGAFYVPWCYYRMEIFEFLGIDYEILKDGEACRQRFLQILERDPEMAREFLNPQNLLTSSKHKSSKDGTQEKYQTRQ